MAKKRFGAFYTYNARFVAVIFGHNLKNLAGRLPAFAEFNFQRLYDLFRFVHEQKLKKDIIKTMLPEVAYVKLAWALDQTTDLDEVKTLMLTRLSHKDLLPLRRWTCLHSRTPLAILLVPTVCLRSLRSPLLYPQPSV